MSVERCNRVLVERYLLGEAREEEKSAARLHIDGCSACRDHMAAMENERREYLLAHPYREFAAAHPEAVSGSPAGRRGVRTAAGSRPEWKSLFGHRWVPALAGLAVCLALIPAALRLQKPEPGIVSDVRLKGDDIRMKGGTLLEFYVKRGAEVKPGLASDSYRSGDELQFVYASGKQAYVTLASIDSRGHVSLYRGTAADAPLSHAAEAGESRPMPFGVTLDDSPGSELFIAIFGSEPLSGGAVESWLTEAFTRAAGNLDGLTSQLAPPPGPPGAEIKTLLLRKTQA